MPIYRIRKYSDSNLTKAGGNAPDTAGIGVTPYAQSRASARSGGPGVLSICSDGVTQQDLYDGAWRTLAGLTNGSANTIFTFTPPAGGMFSGQIEYSLEVSDGTDFQAITGFVTFAAVNKGGTITNTVTEVAGNQGKAVSAGTLVPAWTITNGSGIVSVKVQPTSSLTPTTCRITYFVSPIIGPLTSIV